MFQLASDLADFSTQRIDGRESSAKAVTDLGQGISPSKQQDLRIRILHSGNGLLESDTALRKLDPDAQSTPATVLLPADRVHTQGRI